MSAELFYRSLPWQWKLQIKSRLFLMKFCCEHKRFWPLEQFVMAWDTASLQSVGSRPGQWWSLFKTAHSIFSREHYPELRGKNKRGPEA